MTEEQYLKLQTMLKGCGVCTPMYSKLNRFEKAWFTRVYEIMTDFEKQIEKMKCCENCTHKYCSECKRKKVLSDVDYWELAD